MPLTVMSTTFTGSSTIYLIEANLTNAETTAILPFNSGGATSLRTLNVIANAGLTVSLFPTLSGSNLSEIYKIPATLLGGNDSWGQSLIAVPSATGIRLASTGTGSFLGKLSIEVQG